MRKLLDTALEAKRNIVTFEGGAYTKKLTDLLDKHFDGCCVVTKDKGIVIVYDSAQTMPHQVVDFVRNRTYFKPIKSSYHTAILACNLIADGFGEMSRKLIRKLAEDPVEFEAYLKKRREDANC